MQPYIFWHMEVLLRERLLGPEYERGTLPRPVDADGLREHLRSRLADELVKPEDWEAACLQVLAWQERDEARATPIEERVVASFPKYPTVGCVKARMGREAAARYRAALEQIEDAEGLRGTFPDERTAHPWRTLELDAAVRAAVDVLAPNIGDPAAMEAAYEALVEDMKARKKVRSAARLARNADKRRMARELGLWLPNARDGVGPWLADPTTAPHARKLFDLAHQVSRRMRLARSYLQYIPKRRPTAQAKADLLQNIERMRGYLRGFALRAEAQKTAK